MKEIIYFILLFIILSCNSDEEILSTDSTIRLSKIESYVNDKLTNIATFEYDNNSRLINQTNSSDDSVLKYNYTNGKVTSIEKNSSITTYIYDNDLITSSSNSDENITIKYEYNSLKQLVTSKEYKKEILQSNNNYTSDNENNIIELVYSSSELNYTDNYEYDSMKKPLSEHFNDGFSKIEFNSKHNLIKQTTEDFNLIYTTSYEYNILGYPTVSTQVVNNPDNIQIFRNEYIYDIQ